MRLISPDESFRRVPYAHSFCRVKYFVKQSQKSAWKFPSGRVHLYMTNEQDMPQIGSSYVLFLADPNNETVLQIVSGYELRDGKVYPLDDLPNSRTYPDADETTFLSELRTKIAKL